MKNVLMQLIAECSEVAERQGEEWREGDGAEFMNALQAAQDYLIANASVR